MLTLTVFLANAIQTSAVCLLDTKQIVSSITMTAIRCGPGVQENFTSLKWHSHVITQAELAVRIQRISQNVALLKGMCLKIRAVATCTLSAGMVLRNLLSVRMVYSITVPCGAATDRAAAIMPNYLPEILNVVPLQVASQNHNVQTQRIPYSCRTRATASFSTRVLTVFDRAVAALCNIAGTSILIPATECLVTLRQEIYCTNNLVR